MTIKAKFRYLSNQLKHLNNENSRKILSHPLILLLVGAIVTSIVIPAVSRPWMEQKALELKVALVDDVSKAVADSLASTRSGDTNNNAFATWESSKDLLTPKIEAYFSDDGFTHDWNNLSSAVEQFSFYVLTVPFPQRHTQQPDQKYDFEVCNRLAHLLKLYTSYPQNNPVNIDRNVLGKYHCSQFYYPVMNLQNFSGWAGDQKYFPVRDSKGVNWNALFYWNGTDADEYNRSASILLNDIEDHKNKLIKRIFKMPFTAF
jgi:hypothetical protein